MKKVYLILVCLFLGVACTENQEALIQVETLLLKDTSCPCDDITSTTGTWCCVQRNTELGLNRIVEYEYSSNQPQNNVFGWHVEGDVEVISGTDSNIIQVRFKDDFESALIVGYSDGWNRCGTPVSVGIDIESDHEEE